MLDTLQNQLQLPGSTLLLATAVVLLAGMVRGFSGFGLSALIMAVMAVAIPPIALIPVCFILEAAASLVMFRGGMTDGNCPLVIKLVAGYVLGVPLGLAADCCRPLVRSWRPSCRRVNRTWCGTWRRAKRARCLTQALAARGLPKRRDGAARRHRGSRAR